MLRRSEGVFPALVGSGPEAVKECGGKRLKGGTALVPAAVNAQPCLQLRAVTLSTGTMLSTHPLVPLRKVRQRTAFSQELPVHPGLTEPSIQLRDNTKSQRVLIARSDNLW
jgi:hypothetical protein